MSSRKELHALIDTLPEGAVDPAHMMLSRLQIWPPPPPPRNAATSGIMVRTADSKPVMSRRERRKGDTLIQRTTRNYRGYELRIVECFRVDGKRLIYRHRVSGPGGKRDEREVTFDIPQPEQQ